MSDMLTIDALFARPSVEREIPSSGKKVRIHKVSLGEREAAHKAARERAQELAESGKVDEAGQPVDWDGNTFAAHMVAYGLAEPRVDIARVDELMDVISVPDLEELYDLVQDVTAGNGGTVDERVADFPVAGADAEGDAGAVPAGAGEGVADAPASAGGDPGE